MQQVVQLQVSGLYTNNEYLSEVPAGALLVCNNWNHDRDGMLEKRRGFFIYGDSLGTSTDRCKQLITYKGRVLRHFDTTIDYDNGSGTFTAWTGTFTEPDANTLRLKYQEMNGNLYFTSDEGIKKISAVTADDFSSVEVTNAGGARALDVTASTNYSTLGFLPPLSKVGYRVVWGYKDKNNNLIRGTVSPFTIVTNISETESCVADLEFPIPDDITEDYYYEVYRSSYITTTTLEDLFDISPADELNLIIEDFPPALTGTVSITDITPEDFRVAGTLLYTNAVSGEGTISNNEVPPLAKDLTIYKNYMFYANTKTYHRINLSLLSVLDMVSEDTKLIISDGSQTDEFTFVGAASESSIVWADADYANKDLLKGTYFLLTSPSDERVYFIYFDDDGSTQVPSNAETAGKIPAKIDLSELGVSPSNEEIVDQMLIDLAGNFDFSVSKSGSGTDVTLTITNNYNGNTTPYHISNSGISFFPVPTPAGGSITFKDQNPTIGDGEDTVTQDIILSSRPTPGQQVEETAKSMTKVVNSLSNGLTYVNYISGPSDVPGQMNIQSRELSDTPIYIAMEESTPGANEDFTPTLPTVKAISGFTPSPLPTDNTVVTSASHGYSNGFTVVIYGNSDINGVYTISNVTTNTFEIEKDTFGTSSGSASVFRGTVVTDNEESPNRVYYSKLQQPEAVPVLNYIDIGPKDKAIKRIIGLRDSLFIFKEDGIYRLSGESPTFFVVQLFDSSATILSADSAAVLNNQIFVQTSQGITTVSDTGASIISKQIENVLNKSRQNTNYLTDSFAITSETDRAYYFWTTKDKTSSTADICYRYNTDTRSWTTWDKTAACAVVNSGDDKIYIGATDVNNIEKERKNLDRTDHADREFSLQMGENGINGKVISGLATIEGVEIGDVIYQEQYLTVAEINRLCRKLDIDWQLTNTISSFTTGVVTTIDTGLAHNLNTDEYVTIDQVTGNGADLVNGTHRITVTSATTFTIPVNTLIYTITDGRYRYSFIDNEGVSAGTSIENALISIAEKLQLFLH
jgi:hypothetical protein